MKPTAERLAFYACCVLSAAPLLCSHYPPMIDLPQHAAQVATLDNLSRPDFAHKALFSVTWLRPYLGGYLVAWALSQVVPILAAMKITVALTVVAIPIAASRLRALFNPNRQFDWLLLTVGYGVAFTWGLFNFLVGVPVALLFLAAAFRYAERPSLRSGLWIALFAHVLLAVHLLIAAFGCGLAFLYIAAGPRPWKQKLLAVLPLASPAPAVLAFLAFVVRTSVQANEAGPWGLSVYRPYELITSALALPTTKANGAVALFAFALPFLLGARLTRDRSRLAVLGAYLLWMMVGPDYLLGNFVTFQRFAIFGVPLFLMALMPLPLRPTPSPLQKATVLVYALPLSQLVVLGFLFSGFERETSGYADVVKAMQPGKRVLGLMFDHRSLAVDNQAFLHFASWYQAERGGVADSSFCQNSLLVTYAPEARETIPRGFEWNPEGFDWNRHRGWRFDYFLVRSRRDMSAVAFRTVPVPMQLVARHDAWWLYAPKTGAQPPAPATTR